MINYKSTRQFMYCVIVVTIFMIVWEWLLDNSKNENFSINLPLIISFALGVGWGAYKIIFKKIQVVGLENLVNTIVLSLQITIIIILSMIVLIWFAKLI